MKKKWYRNGMVKTVAAVVGIASLTAAAAGGTSAAGIMSMGVNPLDKGSYLESRSFERSMYDNTYKVLHALAYTQLFHSEQGGENIDLGEILQNRNPTEEKLTGLSYKLSDLKKWAEIDDWNTMTDDILICVKPDGSPEYMYMMSLKKRFWMENWNFWLLPVMLSRMRNMRKMQSMQRTICHWNRKLPVQKV